MGRNPGWPVWVSRPTSHRELLKALLAQLKIEFPFTHDLNYLARQLKMVGEVLPLDESDLSSLGTYAVTHRYDDVPEFLVLDRPAAIETIRLIREFVTSRIATLSGAPLPPPLQ